MKPRPALLLAVLMYLGLDLVVPTTPGVFGFNVADSVEACRIRSCATERPRVAHRRLPPVTSAPQPAVREPRRITAMVLLVEAMRPALPDESSRSAPPSSIDDD